MEFVNLKNVTIPQSVLDRVQETVARENCLIPLSFEKNVLRIAIADPHDIETLEKLVFILNFGIAPVLADRGDILAAIDRHYGAKGSNGAS